MALVLIVVGAVICYLLCNYLYSRFWDYGLDTQVQFSTRQTVVGERLNLVEVITNNKWLPLSMVRIKFQLDRKLHFVDEEQTTAVSDKCYKNDVFSLLFYQRITRTLPFECQKRGFFTIENIDLVSTNLFMNAQYVKSVPIYTELVVYPRLADMSRLDIPFSKIMGECMAKRFLYEDPFEFRGIREYQPYDTMSSINWKATAKTGELRVNVHNYTASQEVRIFLNLENETMWEEDVLKEEAISIAAGLCERLIAAGISVSIATNAKDAAGEPFSMEGGLSKAHMDMLLTGLAKIDTRQKVTPFVEILDEYVALKEENCMYVLISFASGQKLHEKFDELCEKNKGSMWIFPYTKRHSYEVDECANAQLLRWEVTVNE